MEKIRACLTELAQYVCKCSNIRYSTECHLNFQQKNYYMKNDELFYTIDIFILLIQTGL